MAFSFQRQKGVAITNAFQEMLDESNRKPKKIGEDKCREIYNRFMKSCWKKMIQKCIQHLMKQNLLLQKDLLEL